MYILEAHKCTFNSCCWFVSLAPSWLLDQTSWGTLGLGPHPSDVIRSVDNPHHFNDDDWSVFMARPILTYYFSPPRAAFNFYVLIVSPFKCCPGSWSRQRTMKSIEALCNVHKPVMVLSLAFAFAPKTKKVVSWKDPSFIKGSREVRPWGMRWPLAVHSPWNERQ